MPLEGLEVVEEPVQGGEDDGPGGQGAGRAGGPSQGEAEDHAGGGEQHQLGDAG